MSDAIKKKITTGGPQRDNHVPSPGSGAPTTPEPTGTETTATLETQVTEDGAQ